MGRLQILQTPHIDAENQLYGCLLCTASLDKVQ